MRPSANSGARPTKEITMNSNWNYKLINVTDWEFGRIHDAKQALESRGWELDGVVRFNGELCGSEPCVAPVRLRFKRRRSA